MVDEYGCWALMRQNSVDAQQMQQKSLKNSSFGQACPEKYRDPDYGRQLAKRDYRRFSDLDFLFEMQV